MAGVEQWVSDQLHSILGLSDRYVAQFLVNMAQKSSSRQDLVEKIRDTGTISVNDDVIGFMGQLWDKVPHQERREKPARVRERAMQELLEENAKYTLLPDSDDEAPSTTAKKGVGRATLGGGTAGPLDNGLGRVGVDEQQRSRSSLVVRKMLPTA
ncbi:hypothetical protein HPB51_016257 [Rhipicephalus microplus]|uniref:PWI domain-containing protein n=1 Tax=Rhipicephalus microplus TaxID=6941 RepID=A0A9J6EHK9_RHIMP|nr:hypothetical protein HPB51_016257 [Rhipicephalus microplus]